MHFQACFSILIVCMIGATNALRILAIMPIKAKSHFYFHEALFNGLASAGHQITLINPYALRKPVDNFTIIRPPDGDVESPFTGVAVKNNDWITIYQLMVDVMVDDCERVIKMPYIQNLLKSRKKVFDVMFVEFFYMYECYLPIAEKLNVPVIGTLSSFSIIMLDAATGNPRNPAVVPFELSSFGTRMTFIERLQNTFFYVFDVVARKLIIEPRLNTFFTQHHPNFATANLKKISVCFVNNIQSFVARPVVPGIVNVGGIHLTMKLEQQLAKNFQKFIDDAEHGVIYFSLGTITSGNALPSTIRLVLRKAFAKIPQRVIWKFNEDIPGLSDNVMVTKWAPQRDILAHPNVVAFISHCGLMSTYEAIYSGKPMILAPVFGEQPATAARLRELDVGVLLDIMNTSEEKLIQLVNEVVNNTKYRDNMRRLSKALNDNPMTPSELVVYWTEYVLRHEGAAHLRTVAADMPLYQYLLLDVIGFVITVSAVAISLLIYLTKKLFCQVFRPTKRQNSIKYNYVDKKTQ